jgi:hypothetical protein
MLNYTVEQIHPLLLRWLMEDPRGKDAACSFMGGEEVDELLYERDQWDLCSPHKVEVLLGLLEPEMVPELAKAINDDVCPGKYNDFAESLGCKVSVTFWDSSIRAVVLFLHYNAEQLAQLEYNDA